MAWFYNSYSGALIEESAPAPEYFVLEALIHAGNGWHEYGSQADVDAAVAANHWPAPTVSSSKQVSNAASSAESEATSGLGDTLKGLRLHWPSADTFLGRALKIVVGGVLLTAGILKMTGASKAALGVAGQAAGKLPGV